LDDLDGRGQLLIIECVETDGEVAQHRINELRYTCTHVRMYMDESCSAYGIRFVIIRHSYMYSGDTRMIFAAVSYPFWIPQTFYS
jgi:hypothetical protein